MVRKIGVENREPGEVGRVPVGERAGKPEIFGPESTKMGSCFSVHEVVPERFDDEKVEVLEFVRRRKIGEVFLRCRFIAERGDLLRERDAGERRREECGAERKRFLILAIDKPVEERVGCEVEEKEKRSGRADSD